jgi:hypothetical protein
MRWQMIVFIGVIALRLSIITYPIRSALTVSEAGISATAINCMGTEACSINWWDSTPDFTPKTVTGRQLFHDSLAFWEEQYFNLNAANSILCLVRILSYLRINPNISQVFNPFAVPAISVSTPPIMRTNVDKHENTWCVAVAKCITLTDPSPILSPDLFPRSSPTHLSSAIRIWLNSRWSCSCVSAHLTSWLS